MLKLELEKTGLNEKLYKTRINKVIQPSPNDLLFLLHKNSKLMKIPVLILLKDCFPVLTVEDVVTLDAVDWQKLR